MVNEEYDPSPTEEDVLAVMRDEWRANPYLLREETGHDKGTINTALTRLTSAGWVRKVTRGLYEFVDDPREESAAEGERLEDPPEPPETSERANDIRESPEGEREAMEAALDELHVPGRPAAVERTRRKAIAYAWDRLREEGDMRPSKLADDTIGAFFDDPDLNYSVSQQHPGYQLLDNCLREVMLELPGVHSNGRTWEFREGTINE